MNQDLKKVIYSLHPLERSILPSIQDNSTINDIAKNSGKTDSETTTALQLLEQKGYLELEKHEQTLVSLDEQGRRFSKEELPEIQVLKELNGEEKPVNMLHLSQEIVGSALGELKKNQLVESRKEDTLYIKPTQKGEEFLQNHTNKLSILEDDISEEKLSEEQKEVVKRFEKRKGFIKKSSKKYFIVKLKKEGKELVDEFIKKYSNLELLETLTTDMLKSGEWKGKEFRHYDISVPTTVPRIGRKHPMLEANDTLSQVFLEMGFKEMKGPLVESAFWNMDVMWIPQDHPARDEQDTFYLEGRTEIPEDLKESIKEMHEKGIKQTHTSEGDFSYDISAKKLLRTHATATTFRVLSELGQRQEKGENIDGKYFYLANVFRNEAIDATHLAEFYQGEGFIIGDDLSLADLMGFVKEYLAKLGYEGIRFKPTFNPYTEPSMEAHVYDPEIGKSYALINSGVFRPETLEPFGLGNKRIIAWGFGASRIAAKLAGKTSMREITGTTCDLQWLRTRPFMDNKVSMMTQESKDKDNTFLSTDTDSSESQKQGGNK